ncbi:hypothetical protein [Plastoroseomonas arctica]|uniref:Uncharacterized protein n=1 Tax=Plastoroseomonas arctica TaxID=1509237 RepID=A0AAF1JYB6_9PROT|nr:hypothetical protein [Plastoroseomonas arctica]MBR0653510.1 hypothetical protein [Plastoroseomonas arctica]
MAFAEIHEGEAPREIALLYARLRDAMGIPVVNLIWRHAATLPGVLAWMVETAEGVIRSATVRSEREAMLGLGEPGGFADFVVVARRLNGVDQAMLRVMVDTYNRGNLTNLQVLTALRQAIAGEPIGGAPLTLDALPPPMLPALPAQPKLAELPAEIAAEVRALAAFHGGIGDAVPSLYLHLALIPGLLAPLRMALAPMVAAGAVTTLRDTLIARAVVAAPKLRAGMAPPGPFPAAHAAAMLPALDAFAGGLIAEMGGIGAGLARALDQ